MRTLTSLSLTLLLLLSPNLSHTKQVPDSSCGCYLLQPPSPSPHPSNSNSTTPPPPLFFTDHRFFDFRSLPSSPPPPLLNSYSLSPSATPTSPYFSTPPFSDFWMLSNWNNAASQRSDATINMTNSPNNIFLSPSYLSLRTARLETFQTSAEIESTSSKFKYLSIRTLTRTIGSPGAITALFTYRHSSDPSQVQESDLEIRTSDPESLIHYTNQPSLTKDGEVESRATRNSTLPNGLKWSDWLIHRLDWTPEYTAWYVNDILVAQISFQVPRDESNIILNAWSDGGEWTGNMSVGGQAELQVKWIEIVYNSTEAEGGKIKMTSKAKKEKNEGGICGAVCGIDGTGVEEVGKPVLLWDNGGGERIRGSWGLLWVAVGLSVVLLA